jgi:hypothetical protein
MVHVVTGCDSNPCRSFVTHSFAVKYHKTSVLKKMAGLASNPTAELLGLRVLKCLNESLDMRLTDHQHQHIPAYYEVKI